MVRTCFVERIIQSLACACLLGAATGCESPPKHTYQTEAARPMKSIDEVIKQYSDSLMSVPGVVGLYHGLDDSGHTCLKVMVKEKTPELERQLPKQIDGYPVIIEETGEIRPLR